MAKRKKRRKSRKVLLKLSHKQFRSLQNYCKAHKTTTNKVIKKAIKPYTNNYNNDVKIDVVSDGQMSIFDIIEEN